MRRLVNNIKNHNNWLGYYIHKLFGYKSVDFKFHNRFDLNINVPNRLSHTYKECFFDNTYLRGFPESSRNAPLNTVIDIGANVGYFSLFMFSRNAKAKVI